MMKKGSLFRLPVYLPVPFMMVVLRLKDGVRPERDWEAGRRLAVLKASILPMENRAQEYGPFPEMACGRSGHGR